MSKLTRLVPVLEAASSAQVLRNLYACIMCMIFTWVVIKLSVDLNSVVDLDLPFDLDVDCDSGK